MTFGPEDMRPLQTPHNDALVIQLKILTTNGSPNTCSVDIITLECLKNLQYNEKGLGAINTYVLGFEGQAMYPLELKDYLSKWAQGQGKSYRHILSSGRHPCGI